MVDDVGEDLRRHGKVEHRLALDARVLAEPGQALIQASVPVGVLQVEAGEVQRPLERPPFSRLRASGDVELLERGGDLVAELRVVIVASRDADNRGLFV